MSHHTPGPWAYAKSNDGLCFYICQADDASYTPNYSDVAVIITETCGGELKNIQEANAKLMSQAPCLLECLIRCAALIKAECADGEHLDCYQAAIKIINKAA